MVSIKDMSENILQILKTNGFPGKRVSLPTEKMYEAADNKGLSFNQVLQQLKTDHNIEGQVGTDKIVFSQVMASNPLAGMDPQEMIKQAQEMMGKMDPEELKKLQAMFLNMSADEKEDVLKKGKDLGII